MSQLEHAEGTEPAIDRFKEAFKRYKKRDADLNDVVDITRPEQYEKEVELHTHHHLSYICESCMHAASNSAALSSC